MVHWPFYRKEVVIMSAFLECIVDVCLPIAGRWIIIQIASLFGADLNTNTLLWFITVVFCAIIAENFTFHPKKKWCLHKRVEKEETLETLEDENAEAPAVENVEL